MLQSGIKTDLRLKSYGIIREIGKEVTKPWKFYIHAAHTRNALGHTRIALLHTRIILVTPEGVSLSALQGSSLSLLKSYKRKLDFEFTH